MDELMLFTDGSVDAVSQVGFGAYLMVSEGGYPLEFWKKRVKVRQFGPTSSTKLELQTLLWALGDIRAVGRRLMVFTDSQNTMGLMGRRKRCEGNDYRSKKNKRLNNADLYQAFFRLTDTLDCEFIKVHGHRSSNQKDHIDRLFALVDHASRKALRGYRDI